jgi:protein phosphatase
MCSTLTAAIMTADAVHVAHVGDSHAWLVREGAVTLVSEDQSIAAALVRAGELTEEAAAGDPRRHTLTQAIGSVRPLLPQLAALAADRGDRLVLATDGIDYVDADLLAVLLAKPLPAVELADRLVEAAYDVGAPDNVTVVVADVG